MNTTFKYELEKSEINRIMEFCNSAQTCSIEQSLGWNQLFFNSKICYFILQDESGIQSFCQIHEKFGTAQIVFGPVCDDNEFLVMSINEIISFYKKRWYYFLGVEMYKKTGFDNDYVEYKLNKRHNIKYFFDSENTHSSVEINLENSIEDIYSRIRNGHKGSIKKAIKLKMSVEPVKDLNELYYFILVYNRMCLARNISSNELTNQNINDIFNYLLEHNKGYILLAKDDSGHILGGAIFVNQGNTIRYFKAASDPDRREYPVLHLLLYEAIKKAKSDNFKFFDFWGYDHFVNENHQVYNLNQFKRLFGGYFTFFAKKMNISLIPGGYYLFRFLLLAKKSFNYFSSK